MKRLRTWDFDTGSLEQDWSALDRAEAALAQPEQVALTRPDCFDFAMDFVGDPEEADVRRYVEALEARPTIQPVSVSERLPGPEDCLDEGWAWFFNQRIGWRQAVLPVSPGYTHWLPANALPTPEATNV